MGSDPPSSTRTRVAIVFPGGDRPTPAAVAGLGDAELIVAADSGVEHALALGYRVNLIVGDFDSADPAAVDAAVADGATIDRHPPEKDATDLELALLAVRDRGIEEVMVVGGHGGRLDHFLANAFLLAAPQLAKLHIRARVGDADVIVVRAAAELAGHAGDLCSLLPVGGVALGVSTSGLRYPLERETLHPGSTRGVSNELVRPRAHVSLDDGVLLAVLPHARKDS